MAGVIALCRYDRTKTIVVGTYHLLTEAIPLKEPRSIESKAVGFLSFPNRCRTLSIFISSILLLLRLPTDAESSQNKNIPLFHEQETCLRLLCFDISILDV